MKSKKARLAQLASPGKGKKYRQVINNGQVCENCKNWVCKDAVECCWCKLLLKKDDGGMRE